MAVATSVAPIAALGTSTTTRWSEASSTVPAAPYSSAIPISSMAEASRLTVTYTVLARTSRGPPRSATSTYEAMSITSKVTKRLNRSPVTNEPSTPASSTATSGWNRGWWSSSRAAAVTRHSTLTIEAPAMSSADTPVGHEHDGQAPGHPPTRVACTSPPAVATTSATPTATRATTPAMPTTRCRSGRRRRSSSSPATVSGSAKGAIRRALTGVPPVVVRRVVRRRGVVGGGGQLRSARRRRPVGQRADEVRCLDVVVAERVAAAVGEREQERGHPERDDDGGQRERLRQRVTGGPGRADEGEVAATHTTGGEQRRRRGVAEQHEPEGDAHDAALEHQVGPGCGEDADDEGGGHERPPLPDAAVARVSRSLASSSRPGRVCAPTPWPRWRMIEATSPTTTTYTPTSNTSEAAT
jgi:hypothetical protein